METPPRFARSFRKLRIEAFKGFGAISSKKSFRSVAGSLVPVILPGLAKRIAVTKDPELIDAIDGVTSNRSGFLAAAARHE